MYINFTTVIKTQFNYDIQFFYSHPIMDNHIF